MKSIIDNERKCLICGTTWNLERHHVFFGTPSRRLSEKHGLWVYLCLKHHRGDYGVHGKYGHRLDLKLKQDAQAIWEQNGTREEFIEIFGKSYL